MIERVLGAYVVLAAAASAAIIVYVLGVVVPQREAERRACVAIGGAWSYDPIYTANGAIRCIQPAPAPPPP